MRRMRACRCIYKNEGEREGGKGEGERERRKKRVGKKVCALPVGKAEALDARIIDARVEGALHRHTAYVFVSSHAP